MTVNAQKVEHYEIPGYGSLIAPSQLGHKQVAALLEKTLNEEAGPIRSHGRIRPSRARPTGLRSRRHG